MLLYKNFSTNIRNKDIQNLLQKCIEVCKKSNTVIKGKKGMFSYILEITHTRIYALLSLAELFCTGSLFYYYLKQFMGLLYLQKLRIWRSPGGLLIFDSGPVIQLSMPRFHFPGFCPICVSGFPHPVSFMHIPVPNFTACNSFTSPLLHLIHDSA